MRSNLRHCLPVVIAAFVLLAEGSEATTTPRTRLELAAEKALGKQPQFTGRLKPRLSGDEGTLTVRVPVVALDGTGQYASKPTFARVTSEFAGYTMNLFEKVSALKRLTFISDHQGKDVFSVTLSRTLYKKLQLRKVEEAMGAYQGKFIDPLMNRKITAEEVERQVHRKRREVYRKVFSLIPRRQRKISKKVQ